MKRVQVEPRDSVQGHNDVTFLKFMEQALYGKQGYYTRAVRIGGDGADFYTAALSPLFSFTMGRYVVEMWRKVGEPATLQVVEIGAGQGELADGICQWLQMNLPNVIVEYVIVELSSYLEEVQQERLGHLHKDNSRIHVRWGIPDYALPTVLVANEVLDALPVERIRRTKVGWQQAFVRRVEQGYTWHWNSAPGQLAEVADRFVNCPVGTAAELTTGYLDFFQRLLNYGRPLEAALIDYGITKVEWESGVRPNGTLRGYSHHQVVEDVLSKPGEVDLTADVNWDYAAASAKETGFAVQPLMTQAQFLMQFGILDVLQSLQHNLAEQAAQERLALIGQFKQLVFPGGMGERFSVMTCSRE